MHHYCNTRKCKFQFPIRSDLRNRHTIFTKVWHFWNHAVTLWWPQSCSIFCGELAISYHWTLSGTRHQLPVLYGSLVVFVLTHLFHYRHRVTSQQHQFLLQNGVWAFLHQVHEIPRLPEVVMLEQPQWIDPYGKGVLSATDVIIVWGVAATRRYPRTALEYALPVSMCFTVLATYTCSRRYCRPDPAIICPMQPAKKLMRLWNPPNCRIK